MGNQPAQPTPARDLRTKKSRWALLKTRFRNSLSSLNENRERNLLDLQRTANGRQKEMIYDLGLTAWSLAALSGATTSPLMMS